MKLKDYRPELAARLEDKEFATSYLTEVLQYESQEAFLIALRNVVDARKEKISELAASINVTRQGLYKMLSDGGNPRLSTLRELLKSLGMKITISNVDTE